MNKNTHLIVIDDHGVNSNFCSGGGNSCGATLRIGGNDRLRAVLQSVVVLVLAETAETGIGCHDSRSGRGSNC